MIQSYEWLLARRYLRSRRDERFVSLISWSSAIGVAIGVMTLIVVLSVMNGVAIEIRDKILGFSAHVDVQGPGETLANWQQWQAQLQTVPGVQRASPYLSAQVLAMHGGSVSGAILRGLDVAAETEMAARVVDGRFIEVAAENPFQVVVGKELAKKLGVRVGDTMRLLSPSGGISPAGMAPRMRGFEVVGIFDSGFYEFDSGVLLTSLASVQILNRLGDRVTGIELFIADRDNADRVAALARQALPPEAWVVDWMHRYLSFFRALKMERLGMSIVLSLIILVALFNMVASLVMLVMERRKEIAILKTVGTTDAVVMRIFLMMGGLISGLGTLVGALLGLLLAWKLDVLVAWIEQMTGVTFLSGDVYFIDHVPSVIDPFYVVAVVAMSCIVGLLATLYPAWRAAKVPPADALRGE